VSLAGVGKGHGNESATNLDAVPASPLPDEMLAYARADTHYLLYIYDHMRNELVAATDKSKPETDLMGKFLQQCQLQALDRYEYPDFDPKTGEGSGGWYQYIGKNPVWLSGEQFAVFRAIWSWRDAQARKADESPKYLIPNQTVRAMAQVSVPDRKALLGLLPRHMQKPEELVNDLWKVIQDAKVAGRAGPTLNQYMLRRNDPRVSESSGPETNGKTANGTPIDSGDVMPAPIMEQSQLFGKVSVRDGQAVRAAGPEYVPFPWQAARGVFSDAETGKDLHATTADVPQQTSTAVQAAQIREPAFNLRAGTKEMSSMAEHGTRANPAEDVDEVLELGDSQEENKPTSKWARRRAAKAARKAASQEAATGQPANIQPFDYSKAPSVLNAERGQGSVNAAPQTTFNPYSTLGDDGPKGARKAPPLPGSRSATFKS
jgi:exosome complex exonuclease RRP6